VAKQTTPPRGTTSGSTPARRPAAAREGGANRTSPVSFFQESFAELKKVTWPTRQETMNLTGAVIAMTVGIAAFLGIIDTALDQIVKPIIGG
jgi:preprotein translocase SecE subunit